MRHQNQLQRQKKIPKVGTTRSNPRCAPANPLIRLMPTFAKILKIAKITPKLRKSG